MKIEWFLGDLDKSVCAYNELRTWLSILPAESNEYDALEAELLRQIRQLKRDVTKTLEVIDEK
jgi:uncharacterized protein YgfB (UPF0149 family)